MATATKKVIAICQSGGEFVSNKDGSMSYNGGDAYAIDIDQDTLLSDFKSEIAEVFNCNLYTTTIKYFLPGNKRTLITVSRDRDLQRMISFLGDATTVDVFVITEQLEALITTNYLADSSIDEKMPNFVRRTAPGEQLNNWTAVEIPPKVFFLKK